MVSPQTVYRTWVEVDALALQHNIKALRDHLGHGVGVMGVVKANAYGHGLELVVNAIKDRVEWLGVASVTEALEANALAPNCRILILGTPLPSERPLIVDKGFVPVISDLEEAQAYAALGGAQGFEAHLAIDSGMGRIGVWETEAVALARACQSLKGLRITGIGTHLPVSDEDDGYTLQQLTRFRNLVQELRSMNLFTGIVHSENSAGAIGFPAEAGDLIRLGLALYGCSPRSEFQSKLKSALRWNTRISIVRSLQPGRTVSYGRTYTVDKHSRIATLAVGYADGFQRHLSNRGAEVLVHGVRCPVLGRVTMDQIMIDVSLVGEARAGDTVVLLGRQGEAEIPVSEIAQKAGTIPWEIFTGIGPRVKRLRAI